MPTLLTKSRYMNGLQCPLFLWTRIHKPEELPKIDEAAQYRFDEGHIVGEFAKKLFPEGIDIQTDDFSKNLAESAKLAKERKTLFEAAFTAGRLYARADVLVPAGKDEWDIVEVKSSTKVKDEHVQDVAFQKNCYEKAGLKIRHCFLVHLNNEYVRKGEIDVNQLFVKQDITSEVGVEIKDIGSRITEMLKIIDGNTPPKIAIGPFCTDPYDCPLMEKCWSSIPEHGVFDLYYAGKRAFELFERGIVTIDQIPADYPLSVKQSVQRECVRTGKPHVDSAEIKKFIKSLEYPLHFLDFETFATAIPLYDGLRPHEAVPFQFSLHIVGKNGKTKHTSFIARGSDDPRTEFIKHLNASLGKTGSIIVYNKSFEQGILERMAKVMPREARPIARANKRIVDLLEPFRKFYYYNPKQHGSASLKTVLPAVTGKDYEGLEIKEGQSASVLYFYATHGKAHGLKASETEIAKIFQNLEKYCTLDTEGMIWIVDKLRELTGK